MVVSMQRYAVLGMLFVLISACGAPGSQTAPRGRDDGARRTDRHLGADSHALTDAGARGRRDG